MKGIIKEQYHIPISEYEIPNGAMISDRSIYPPGDANYLIQDGIMFFLILIAGDIVNQFALSPFAVKSIFQQTKK